MGPRPPDPKSGNNGLMFLEQLRSLQIGWEQLKPVGEQSETLDAEMLLIENSIKFSFEVPVFESCQIPFHVF